MSVNNFIPQVWSATLLKERDIKAIAVKNCNRNFEGEIKDKGDRVKISGIGDIKIDNYIKNVTQITPEELTDLSTMLEITESKYFAFKIDDVDKAQVNVALMQEAMRKSALGLANVADTFIYGKYTEAGSTVTNTGVTIANILSLIQEAEEALLDNNVPENEERYLEVSPWVYSKIVLANIMHDTNNSELLKQGARGMVLGFKIFVSNNINKAGTKAGENLKSNCIARTKNAISFAEQINKVEAYRPESSFSDAVKGLHLYGAKVVYPKELVHLELTYAPEATI